MHRYLKTEAIVLKKKQLLHKDTFITFFTKEQGKITAVAKGVRSITSKRISSLMTGNLIQTVFYHKNERYYLQDAQIISLFSSIKKNEFLQKDLYFYFFVLDHMLAEGQREEKVYILSKQFQIELSKGRFSQNRMTYYCNRLLALFGYAHHRENLSQAIEFIEEIIGKKIPIFII